jgi:sortase A
MLFGLWLVALVVALGLVIFGFGPVFQDRIQRSLLRSYRVELDHAANGGTTVVPGSAPVAPDLGSTVGIIELGQIHVQEAVVEGVRSSDTRKGPGHVPGTAGLGQPGNSVVVGRRSGFGGSFGSIGDLKKDAKIVVTTTQGQSVYEVTKVEHVHLHGPDTGSSGGGTSSAPTKAQLDAKAAGLIDTVYGPSSGDQLTLVTSSSSLPWNSSDATIVIAKMADAPFPPTVQGGRTAGITGGQPDRDAKAAAVLALLVYGLTLGGAVVLHRRLPRRVAYLLTVAPIVAMTIVAGETFSRLLPAWM